VQGTVLDDELQIEQPNAEKQENVLVSVKRHGEWSPVSLVWNGGVGLVLQDMIEAVEVSVAKENEVQAVTVEMFHTMQSKSEYKEFLQQLNTYNQFYKNIVEQMCDEKVETRQQSIKLMSQILKTIPSHLNNVFQDIDLNRFFTLNIFQQNGANLVDIQNLLSYFSEDAEIQTKIVHQLLFCLKNLEKYKITPNGLQSFMVILNIFHNNIEDELLSKLHQVALQVKRLKNPIYGILRSQYSLPSLSLEKSVFSSANVFFKENHVNSFA